MKNEKGKNAYKHKNEDCFRQLDFMQLLHCYEM